MVGGGQPFYLKFWVNRPALERNLEYFKYKYSGRFRKNTWHNRDRKSAHERISPTIQNYQVKRRDVVISTLRVEVEYCRLPWPRPRGLPAVTWHIISTSCSSSSRSGSCRSVTSSSSSSRVVFDWQELNSVWIVVNLSLLIIIVIVCLTTCHTRTIHKHSFSRFCRE